MTCWLLGHFFMQVGDWLVCSRCGKKVSVEPIGWRMEMPTEGRVANSPPEETK